MPGAILAIAAVPGAVPPPAPCSHSATWRIPENPALSAEGNLLARGMDQVVTFDSLTPPLRTLCPVLPWRNQANDDVSLVPHMALCTVAWAMFLLHDSSDNAVVEDWLLTPLSITRGMRRCVDQRLSMDAQEASTVVMHLAQHVRLHYHADFELHLGDLSVTEATGSGATQKPAARLGYSADMTLLSLSTATRALSPMCTYEYVMGPRFLNISATPVEEGRHHPKSHYSRMWAKLTSVQATLPSSVQPVVADAGSTPEGVADAQLTAAGEFFRRFSLPSHHPPILLHQVGGSFAHQGQVSTGVHGLAVQAADALRPVCPGVGSTVHDSPALAGSGAGVHINGAHSHGAHARDGMPR